MNRRLHVMLDVARVTEEGDGGDPSGAIDPELGALLALCRERAIAATILSPDPLGSVRPMLHRDGWDEVRVVTERACWLPDEEGAPARSGSFPFANTGCDRCPHCRRNLMMGSAADGDVLVYAGDGSSDPCPAAYADIVFARGRLQTWCREQNITYTCFGSFGDIRRRLEDGCADRTLRPRPAAERRRREAYLAEA